MKKSDALCTAIDLVYSHAREIELLILNYYFFIIKLALQHAHIKLRIMTYACTIKLCMLEGMLASSASTLKVYNVH